MYSSNWDQNTPQFSRNHWNSVWNRNSNQNYPIQHSSSFNSIGKNNGYREFSHSPSPICPELYTTTKMIQQDSESKEQNHQEAKKPPRIPTGAEELLDSYTYKKAKRFINNCDREHPSPQPFPEKPEKFDIAVPTVTQVSGIFALYQVVRARNFSKTAKNCFPELFPDYLEFLTINQESILSNYRFSSVPSLLIGDILAVKWAWLNSENAVAGEFQILERKISINRFFLPINRFEGVAYGIEGTVGLLYPKDTKEIGKTSRGTIFEPFEVDKVGKCAPLIIQDFGLAGNLKNLEELIFFENWQIFGEFFGRQRKFFSTVSQGKSIIDSIYSPEAPPPSRPRNSQKFLEKFLEPMRKMDFLTEFQKTWTTRMLQRNPLVLGITVDPIYSNLAISAYCMAQKWLGTHLVLADNSRKSLEIFENLLEISNGSKLKIRRYDYSNPNYSNPENYSNPDILITDCSSILEIRGKLKNVKSVQFDRIFGIPNEILGRIFVEFCDSWSFGFMENLEKIPENSGISGISGRFETAIIGGKFEILDVRKDLDMEDLGF